MPTICQVVLGPGTLNTPLYKTKLLVWSGCKIGLGTLETDVTILTIVTPLNFNLKKKNWAWEPHCLGLNY